MRRWTGKSFGPDWASNCLDIALYRVASLQLESNVLIGTTFNETRPVRIYIFAPDLRCCKHWYEKKCSLHFSKYVTASNSLLATALFILLSHMDISETTLATP